MAGLARYNLETTMRTMILGVMLAAGLAGVAGAQAPAGAPAGSSGICKDGTYSTAASKSGACRGHKGVQTWYLAAAAKPATPAAASTPAMPAPKAAAPAPAMPAPTPSAPVASRPAPTPAAQAPAAPAPTTTAKRLSPTQAAAQKPQAAGGGPGLVWVNTASNVYHCNGDAFYGKTKAGKYMSEDQAKAAGAHGERGATCAGK